MVIESSLALPVKAPLGNWIFRVENILTSTITTASIYTLNESTIAPINFLGNTTIHFRVGNSELTQLSGNHQSHFGNDVKIEIIIILLFFYFYTKTIVII